MLRAAFLLAVAAASGATAEGALPSRVVSMNLCTDQLAMMLAEPGQLVSVSRIARDPVSSALWAEAAGWPEHGGGAEEIHLLRPDLVLAGDYDPAATVALLRRLGIRVEVFGIEESFADIRANMRRMGALLGTEARAEALITEMDRRLDAPPSEGPRPRAALYYSNGYTSGAGTLANEVLEAAGYSNVAVDLGIRGMARLPLEVLVMDAPDLLVTGQDYAAPALAQGILEHPAIRTIGAERATVADNLWSCGTPLIAGAVEDLRAKR
jgi:iron complex transport system substrate-binding protein